MPIYVIYMYISWSSVGAHTAMTAKISQRGGIEERKSRPIEGVIDSWGYMCYPSGKKKKEAGTKQYVIKM